MEVVLLQYSSHFIQCINSTDSKTAPENYFTTTTVLDSCYSAVVFE